MAINSQPWPFTLPLDLPKQNALKVVMGDTRRLVTPVKKLSPFEWRIDCCKIGVDCLNPLTAMTLAQFWKDEYAEFEETVEMELSNFQ